MESLGLAISHTNRPESTDQPVGHASGPRVLGKNGDSGAGYGWWRVRLGRTTWGQDIFHVDVRVLRSPVNTGPNAALIVAFIARLVCSALP